MRDVSKLQCSTYSQRENRGRDKPYEIARFVLILSQKVGFLNPTPREKLVGETGLMKWICFVFDPESGVFESWCWNLPMSSCLRLQLADPTNSIHKIANPLWSYWIVIPSRDQDCQSIMILLNSSSGLPIHYDPYCILRLIFEPETTS